MWQQNLVSGTAEVTQHIVSLVVQQDVFNLEVSVDDRRLALMQAGHGLAGVTEDVEDLCLTEAHIQPLVHLLHHLTRFTVFHEDQDLPDAVRHSVDCGVQVSDNVLVA